MTDSEMVKCSLCGKECPDYKATIGTVQVYAHYVPPLHYTFVMCDECDNAHYAWVMDRMKNNGQLEEQ